MLCFGSEGFGLEPFIQQLANESISISKSSRVQQFPNTLIDSLNVSVACAILISEHMSKFK